jgi:hypothetical protein
LDLYESGIIGKPFKRTSTAIGFKFFYFTLEYFKRLQSPEPLHAELNPILLLVRITVCMCSSRDLFRQTRFACAQAAIFFAKPYSLNAGEASIDLWVAACIHHSAIQTKLERHSVGFFHQITVRQQIGRPDSMQPKIRTSRRLGSILHEAAQNFEVVSNIQH